MITMSDQELADLQKLLMEANTIQKKMADSLVDQRSHIIALQLAFLAVAEQLAAKGDINIDLVVASVQRQASTIEPERMKASLEEKVSLLADALNRLAKPAGSPPPRGSGPKLVK